MRMPAVALLAFLLFGTAAPVPAETPSRVAVINWGIAQTVLALGVAPVALANVPDYRKWVAEPAVPPGTADIGRRLEPSLNALAGARPDLIAMSGHYHALRQRLARIAPVETFTLFEPGGDPLARALDMAERLGRRLDRPAAAEALRNDWDASLAALRGAVASAGPTRVYVVQFRDAGHVRVFGEGSLYHGVLARAGLDNAWTGATTFWGFSLVEIGQLGAAADLLLVIEPVPARAEAMMRDSAIWQALPVVRAGEVVRLDPVWSFGSLPSAIRFSGLLADALESR